MGWATDNVKLRRLPVRTIADRYDRAGRFPTKYWTPEVHVAAFALPRFIAEKVAEATQRRSGAAPGKFSAKPSPSRRRS
jgi:spermidine synthase